MQGLYKDLRTERVATASASRLLYDSIVDSARLLDTLGGDQFDVIVDPGGGELPRSGAGAQAGQA